MKQFKQITGIALAGFLIAGCGTSSAARAHRQPHSGGGTVSASEVGSPEIEKTRLSSLEGQIEVLATRVNQLVAGQQKLQDELYVLRNRESAQPTRRRSVPKKLSNRQLQRALITAGFYGGTVDGKVGRQTKQAVKAFQRAHGLKADGIVGRQTVAALAQYLE